jgi:hypothetical protein
MVEIKDVDVRSEFKQAFEKLNLVLQRAGSEEKAFLDKVLKILRQNMELSAEDVAQKIGISRRALFYRLERLGISFMDIKNALIYEAQLRRKEKVVKKEIKRLPPKDISEFMEREVVKEFVKKLTAGNIAEHTKRNLISFWFRLCRELNIAPEDFTDPEKLPQVREAILEYLAKQKENGRETRDDIAYLQALQMWLEVNILPVFVKQEEYRGKFQSAELPPEVRKLMVEKLIAKAEKNKRYKELYQQTLRSWIFLYHTGSRSEALTNFVVEGKIRVRWEEFKRVYSAEEFLVVKTEEKGKKGRKFTWRKLIPITWAHLIPQRNLTKTEVSKVRQITREILLELMNERPELFNSDTVRYIKDAKKTLHLWRHTFAREALRAFRWNRYLVAKMGGWIKDSNLQIYGDYDLLSLLEVSAEEHKIEFCSEVCKRKIEEFLSM